MADSRNVAAAGVIPNLFIVGAPKCGTTALAQYLREHPSIFMSPRKEPNWFCEDLPQLRDVHSEEAYFALFAPRTPAQTVVGEASTWYLFSRVAIPRIRELNPAAKFIVMVRNPVQMVYSLWGQFQFNAGIVDGRFEEEWRWPRNDSPHFDLRRVGRLGEQVARAFERVPRELIRVIVFDDFAADTAAVYREVLGFLGLPDDGRREFTAVNRSKQVASPSLARFVRHTPRPLVNAANCLKRALGIRRIGLLDRVEKLNHRSFARPPLAPELAEEMRAVFHDDILLLGRLLERDLSSWLEAPAAATAQAAPA